MRLSRKGGLSEEQSGREQRVEGRPSKMEVVTIEV